MGQQWRRVAMVVAGVLVVAACGGGDGDDGEAAASSTTVAADTVAAEEVESRFTGTDAYCRPPEGEPEEAPRATAPGITADEVVIAHIRTTTEQLVGIGFAVDIGDGADQAATFTDVINSECGGIHGRRVRMETVEIGVAGLASDADAEAQEVCIKVAEDLEAVMAYTYSGASEALHGCLTARHDVVFLTNYAVLERQFDDSEGRLLSVSHSPEEQLAHAARVLADELEGKRIGIVHQDNAGGPEIVQQGLVRTLEELGLDPVRVDALGCNNSALCTDNFIPSVQGMVDDRVDVIFPLLSTINMPKYLSEMVTQGVEPGQFTFYNTGYHAQDVELVAGKVVEFAGAEAGALYDGATVIGIGRPGRHRLPGQETDAFSRMCNEVYAEHSSLIAAPYQPSDEESAKLGATAGHCAMVRIIARAIEAAGPNPTREDLAAAVAGLGEVDLSGSTPGSFAPGKHTAPDVISRLTFHYLCPLETTNPVGHCFVPEEEFLPLPE